MREKTDVEEGGDLETSTGNGAAWEKDRYRTQGF